MKWNDFINWFALRVISLSLKMMKKIFNITFINYVNKIFPICHYTVLQWRIQGRGLGAHPPLFLDQTEARWAEKNILEDAPPILFQGLDDLPPSLIWIRHGNYKPFYRVQG